MYTSNRIYGLRIFVAALLVIVAGNLRGQSISSDPDSVITEWLDRADWEGISLHPDIVMEWLQDMDSSSRDPDTPGIRQNHLVSFSMPASAVMSGWKSDDGPWTTPISAKYRVRASNYQHWEVKVQIAQNAGDSLTVLNPQGVPRQLTGGILIHPGGLLRDVVIGDFQITSGFGAVLGSSPVFSGALGNPGALHRTGKGIRVYSGSGEGPFFRGLAGGLENQRISMVVFASGKNIVNQEVAGLSISTTFSGVRLGVSGVLMADQFTPEPKGKWLEAWQPDSGRVGRAGAWSQIRLPFGIAFAEMGWSPKGSWAWIAGMRLFEAHGFSATVRYAGCSPGYPVSHTIFQSGKSKVNEGQRVISSFRYSPVRQYEWLGSLEIGLSAWPGSNSRFYGTTTRIVHQFRYLSKNLWSVTGSVQLDFSKTYESVPERFTWKAAFDSNPKSTTGFRFRTVFRQQLQGSGDVCKTGNTADCSLSYSTYERTFRITAGCRVFRTEEEADPLYAYEPDVTYGWSAPVLSGAGTRWFAAIRYRISKNCDVEGKLSQTVWTDLKHKEDDDSVGFGAKLQLVWRIAG